MLYLSSTYIFLKTFLSAFDKLISVEVLFVGVDGDLATTVDDNDIIITGLIFQ